MPYSIFTLKERNTITLILLLILSAIILYAVRGIIGAILGTFVMYTLFRPVNIWLVERLRWKGPVAAVVLIVISFMIIVLPFLGIGTMLTNKILYLLDNPDWITNVVESINKFVG